MADSGAKVKFCLDILEVVMSAVREVASNAPREAVTGSTREAGAGALWEAVCAEPEQWSAVQLQPAPGWELPLAALLSGASDLFNAPTTLGVVFVHPIFLVCLFYVVCVCAQSIVSDSLQPHGL